MIRSCRLAGRIVLVAALLTMAGACGRSDITAPTPVPSSSPVASANVTWAPAWPSPSRPARVYATVSRTSWSTHSSALHSRFVLFEDGVFALQYSSASRPFFEYVGTYREAGGTLTFDWDGWSAGGPWGATGRLTERELAVTFNVIMSLSDFEDAVYVRSGP